MDILDTGFDLETYEMRKHIFAVTTMTPMLCSALQTVKTMYEKDEKYYWDLFLINNVINACTRYVHETAAAASCATHIPIKVLYRCDSLYAVYESVRQKTALHEDKSMWKLAFTLSLYEEKRDLTDHSISIYQICRDTNSSIQKCTKTSLIQLFQMYIEKIENWLKEEFSEESESSNWSDENTEYHDVFEVLSGLQTIVENLKRTSGKTKNKKEEKDVVESQTIDTEDIAVQRHIFAATVMTQKFTDVLTVIKLKFENDPNFLQQAENLLNLQEHCIADTIKKINKKLNISEKVLKKADEIYNIHDEVIISMPIREKIEQWKLIFSVVAQENGEIEKNSDLNIYNHIKEDILSGLPMIEICDAVNSLQEFIFDMEAWMELYFQEAYDVDNWTIKESKYYDFYRIWTGCKQLINELKEYTDHEEKGSL